MLDYPALILCWISLFVATGTVGLSVSVCWVSQGKLVCLLSLLVLGRMGLSYPVCDLESWVSLLHSPLCWLKLLHSPIHRGKLGVAKIASTTNASLERYLFSKRVMSQLFFRVKYAYFYAFMLTLRKRLLPRHHCIYNIKKCQTQMCN